MQYAIDVQLFEENQLHTSAGQVSEYGGRRSLLTCAHTAFLTGWELERAREG